ncbi:unnamed protein product [Citrullus colocynthis]|uniref:Uncharacterized protein n=1 Tax=Citrullus colocynthis TaxID=252529 RepID=A0ABP0Y7Z2_9ROSI
MKCHIRDVIEGQMVKEHGVIGGHGSSDYSFRRTSTFRFFFHFLLHKIHTQLSNQTPRILSFLWILINSSPSSLPLQTHFAGIPTAALFSGHFFGFRLSNLLLTRLPFSWTPIFFLRNPRN